MLALEGHKELITLKLKGPDLEEVSSDEIYGQEENMGKIFDLKDDCWPKTKE